VVAVNDPFITGDYMAYMFKYDSVHGKYVGTVEGDEEGLYIDNKKVRLALCRPDGTPSACCVWELSALSSYNMWCTISWQAPYLFLFLQTTRS